MDQLRANIRSGVGMIEEVVNRGVERSNGVGLRSCELLRRSTRRTMWARRDDYGASVIYVRQQGFLRDVVTVSIIIWHHRVLISRHCRRSIDTPDFIRVEIPTSENSRQVRDC